MLMRATTGDTPGLRTAAAVLAGRQPQNPFLLYLHLGTDKRVQELLVQQCDPTRPQTEYSDWTWQRAVSDTEKAWERSMRWDCQFMHNLLAPS
jgi:hypothetical protein